jgi:hypothetical protein
MSEPVIRPLKIPLPPTATEVFGVFQGDVIIRTAIVAALSDIRANPWLLDFCFASLPRDTLTFRDYGEKEVSKAKEWFQKENVEVTFGVRPYEGAPPKNLVSIHLMSSKEEQNTLGDVHHHTIEEWEASWEPLTARFSPVSYSATTGLFKLPSNIATELAVSTNMAIVDRTGKKHAILGVLDQETLELEKGTVADFTDCFIKPAIPAYVASLESAKFREVFIIGCHAAGEPVNLTYLHSVVVFALLRYRQSLFEERGLQVSGIDSSDFKANDIFDDVPEHYWSRYITLTGVVEHVWPKHVDSRFLTVETSTDPTDPQNDKELLELETMDSIG